VQVHLSECGASVIVQVFLLKPNDKVFPRTEAAVSTSFPAGEPGPKTQQRQQQPKANLHFCCFGYFIDGIVCSSVCVCNAIMEKLFCEEQMLSKNL